MSVNWAGGGDGSVGVSPHPAVATAAASARIHGPARRHWHILLILTQRFQAANAPARGYRGFSFGNSVTRRLVHP